MIKLQPGKLYSIKRGSFIRGWRKQSLWLFVKPNLEYDEYNVRKYIFLVNSKIVEVEDGSPVHLNLVPADDPQAYLNQHQEAL